MTDLLQPLVDALRPGPTPAVIKLATVTAVGSSGVTVQFDGEGSSSAKLYRYLGPYGPNVGDRVMMTRAGSTWVVSGPVYQGLGWTTFPYAASWANLGGGFRGAEYRGVGRMVEMRGVVSYTGGGTSATAGTMPSGLRPAADEIARVSASVGGVDLYIRATGVIQLSGTAIPTGGWISLTGVRYERDGS